MLRGLLPARQIQWRIDVQAALLHLLDGILVLLPQVIPGLLRILFRDLEQLLADVGRDLLPGVLAHHRRAGEKPPVQVEHVVGPGVQIRGVRVERRLSHDVDHPGGQRRDQVGRREHHRVEAGRLPCRLRRRIAVPGEHLALAEVRRRPIRLGREEIDEAHFAPLQHLIVPPGNRVLEPAADLLVDVVVLLERIDHERHVLRLRLRRDLVEPDGGHRCGLQLPDGHLPDHLAFVPLRAAGVDLQLYLAVRGLREVLRHRLQELVPAGTLWREGAQLDPHAGLPGRGGGSERQGKCDSVHAMVLNPGRRRPDGREARLRGAAPARSPAGACAPSDDRRRTRRLPSTGSRTHACSGRDRRPPARR